MLKPLAAISCAAVLAAPALAGLGEGSGGLDLNMAATMAHVDEPAIDASAPRTPWGVVSDEHPWYITIGGLGSHNFKKDMDFSLFADFSTFVADKLEIYFEGAVWMFAQKGPDTVGISAGFGVRYHFFETLVEGTQERDWTVFVEGGIGILVAANKTPAGGTNVNFLPRAGVGFTKRLTEDLRLLVEVGWHHVSNGRLNGDSNNPARDGVMALVGVTFPF